MKSEVTYNLEYLLMCTDQNLNNFGVFRTRNKQSEKWLTVLLETYSKISISYCRETCAPMSHVVQLTTVKTWNHLRCGFFTRKKVKL